MEKDIVEEIVKECNIKKEDKVLTKVLINICKYYKIENVRKMIKYIKSNTKT